MLEIVDKDKTPLLSVIVPVYNAEATIEKCVNSILNNSFSNFELILINDGSLDNSGSICDRISEMDCRVKVHHKQNGGVGAARNDGIERAIGKYLAFVDSDDYVTDQMYEILLQKAQMLSADCVVCNITKNYPSYSKKESHVFGNQIISGREDIHKRIVIPLITPGHQDAALLQGPWNKLYRRTVVQNKAIRFSHLPYAEDWLFNIEFLMNAEVVAFEEKQLYFYNCAVEGSLSKKWRKDSFKNTVWIQNKLAELFPAKYTEKQLQEGILGIQEECLRNYIYFCGVKGFAEYTQQLFSTEALRNAYVALEQVPKRYRFPKNCIHRGWNRRYGLWCLYRVKWNIIKYIVKRIIRKVK